MVVINWNVVCINFHPAESLLNDMRARLTDLDQHLTGFPTDSMYLLAELTRNLETDIFTAAFTLRLPMDILRSEGAAREAKQAFEAALKGLASQLTAQKPAEHGKGEKVRFAKRPIPAGTGPQNFEDVVREQAQRREVHA